MISDSETLAGLDAEISACRICRDAPGTAARLPHEPRPIVVTSATARILIAGQAPGVRVHASGRPFTDPSGDRLRAWMGVPPEVFYDRSRVAIGPMGFCFPGLDAKGSDLPPRRECAARWQDRLMTAMGQVELVLAIGQYAQRYHLGARRGRSLTETVLRWREYVEAGEGPAVLPLPHPSWRNSGWLKRHPWFEAEVLPFLKAEVARLVGSG
ncbi:MAG: uracil-DNA glycosylase family protein [Pararhizobium sp.]